MRYKEQEEAGSQGGGELEQAAPAIHWRNSRSNASRERETGTQREGERHQERDRDRDRENQRDERATPR